MKYVIVLAFLVVAVAADVSHLKSSAERQYLPPELPRSKDIHHGRSYEEGIEPPLSIHRDHDSYVVSKPKALPDPPAVVVPRSKLHTSVAADLPLKQRLFSPAHSDGVQQAQPSDHVLYATAPNSVFHTQINVQSQGSEFNVPNAEPGSVSGQEGRASHHRKNNHYDQSDHSRQLSHYNHDTERSYERSYHSTKAPTRNYQHDTKSHSYDHSRSHGSNKNSDAYRRTDQYEKSPNFQGVNLINGNIAADQASRVSQPPENFNGNAQGINVINGNILGYGGQSRQYSHERSHDYNGLKTYEHHNKEPKSYERKSEDVHHYDHKDQRQYDSQSDHHDNRNYKNDKDHKQHDHHDHRDYKQDHNDRHDSRSYKQDHHKQDHHDNHDSRSYKTDKQDHNDHHDSRSYKQDHNDRHDSRSYKPDHNDHHDSRSYKQDHHKQDHHDNHDSRSYKTDKQDHNDHHDSRSYKPDHNDRHDSHSYKQDHNDHHDSRSYKQDNQKQDLKDQHDPRNFKTDHNEHKNDHQIKHEEDYKKKSDNHDHHETHSFGHRKHTENHYYHDEHKQRDHHDSQYRYTDGNDNRKNAADQYNRDHRTSAYTYPERSVISPTPIKIIAFNNHNSPQLQIPTRIGAQATDFEFDSSASASELIYKPGDEIDFAETKLVDYADNHRPLDTYSYKQKKGPIRSPNHKHGGTDLRADGYHYTRPSVSFNS